MKWQSEDKDINNFFREGSGAEGEKKGQQSPLPYRFATIDRVKPSNRWTARANETVYRFFGDIRANTIKGRDGTETVQLKLDGTNFRRQFMQEIWTDVGTIPSQSIPFYLRRVPVPAWTPLSRAIGLVGNGKPNSILMQRNRAGNPPYDATKGVKPVLYHWAACHITQYVAVEGGQEGDQDNAVGIDDSGNPILKFEYPAVVLMKNWQVTELLKTMEAWREHLGYGWSAVGYPMHILNQTMARAMDTGLKVTKGGIFREEDAEVYDMSAMEHPDFNTMAVAVIEAMDEFLVENGCPIKGWPEDDSHPDGWDEPVPLVISQGDQIRAGGLDVFSGDDEEEEPIKETPANKWEDYSMEDLLDVAQEYGVKVPARSRNNRQKVIFLIETAQAAI